MTRELPLSQASGLFDGHFPGRPILPGVAQLVLMLGGRPLKALRHARFRRIVTPGETLALTVSEGDGIRFETTSAGVRVAEAVMVLGSPEPAEDWMVAVASRRVMGAPPIDALLPHRPPMRFVLRIAGEADDGLTCEAGIPGACALVECGAAPAIVALEAAAQTAAVWEALRRGREGSGGARLGYLVSARDVVLHAERIPAEAPLTASVRLTARAGSLAHYAVDVSLETHPILRGSIGTFL